ncbi:MAG: TetR/AcrR family transcriptional regulator, partial [Bacteroidota bacterium]
IMPGDQDLSLMHLELIFSQFFEVQSRFSFFFSHLQYLHQEYPSIIHQYRVISRHRLDDARALVSYFVQTGRLKPEDDVFIHESLIKNIWISNTFWQLQSSLLGEKEDFGAAMQHVWATILPYLTPKGFEEYLLIKQERKNKQ